MTVDLSRWFVGVAWKRLSEVEINPESSNQHEIQATRAIQSFLGKAIPRRHIQTTFIYMNDEIEPIVLVDSLKYYDSREGKERSGEPRLYYRDNDVTLSARPNDILIFGSLQDGSAVALIAKAGSTVGNQLLWLFNFQLDGGQKFVSADESVLSDPLSAYDAELLLDLLGLEAPLQEPRDVEAIRDRFGSTFPKTAEFSSFAREWSNAPDPLTDPDGALLAWWDTEYRLFQAFERVVIEEHLATGFHGEGGVERFLTVSLSIQNRRKSRSGHAFEHHLRAVFDACNLPYQRNALTERKSKPDFLIPSQKAYEDSTFPDEWLRMLGAKTTAKDRWRQILTEADRIQLKHLVTLQPAISEDQTDEMLSLGVQLVVPKGLHESYTKAQRSSLWSLEDFIENYRQSGNPEFR